MASPIIVVADEGLDLPFEAAGQVIFFQQGSAVI